MTNKTFAINLFVPEKHQASSDQIKQVSQCIEQACRELNIKIHPVKPPFSESFEEQIQVVLEEKVPIFSFTFGIPEASWLSALKKNNTLLIGTATNLAEAKLLQAAGVDALVAQGSESGGHRGTFIGKAEDSLISLVNLLPQLFDSIKIPIIAAGGIMNAQDVVAALTLGASCVQMGTAFIRCPESGAHQKYKEILGALTEDKTIFTTCFSGKLARGIRNKFIDIFSENKFLVLDYPIQNALTRPMRKEAEKQNCIEFMSMWAGQNASSSKEIPAANLISELNREIN